MRLLLSIEGNSFENSALRRRLFRVTRAVLHILLQWSCWSLGTKAASMQGVRWGAQSLALELAVRRVGTLPFGFKGSTNWLTGVDHLLYGTTAAAMGVGPSYLRCVSRSVDMHKDLRCRGHHLRIPVTVVVSGPSRRTC